MAVLDPKYNFANRAPIMPMPLSPTASLMSSNIMVSPPAFGRKRQSQRKMMDGLRQVARDLEIYNSNRNGVGTFHQRAHSMFVPSQIQNVNE